MLLGVMPLSDLAMFRRQPKPNYSVSRPLQFAASGSFAQ